MQKNAAYTDLISIECLNSHQKIDQKDLLGRVVLYFVFRETDVLSMLYLHKIQTWADHYKKQLIVLGVYSPKYPKESEKDYVDKLIHQYDIRIPLFLDSQGFIKKVFSMKVEPGFVVFDTLGRRRSIGSGNIDLKALHDSIVALINGQLQIGGKFPLNSILLERSAGSNRFLRFPENVAYHPQKKYLFVSDTGHSRIVVSDINGKVEFIIGSGERGDEEGDIRNCKLDTPKGICLLDDLLFIADAGSHRIKCVDLASGMLKNIVGTGALGFYQASAHKGKRLSLSYPTDVKIFQEEGKNYLLIANSASRQILKYDIIEDKVEAFLGTGKEKYEDDDFRHASLLQTTNLMTDIPGFVFLNDSIHGSLRLAHAEKLKTVAGGLSAEGGDKVGKALESQFCFNQSLAWDQGDKIFISDTLNDKIKYLSLSQKSVHELKQEEVGLDKPMGLCYAEASILVVDCFNHRLLRWDLKEQSWSDIVFHFAEKLDESRESVPHLPKLDQLKLEEKRFRAQMRSVDIQFSVDLPPGYSFHADSSSKLIVYEKHMTHWYMVRKINISHSNSSVDILLRNVGQTDHYVVDLRLKLCRDSARFEYIESNYRLHVIHDPKQKDTAVVWKVKAIA